MQGLFRFLIKAFDDLGASIPNDKLEKMAVVIYSAMSNPARNYHNLDHVFNFTDPHDPVLYLAAVFHDLVYYQVDDGILPELQSVIEPYLRREDGKFFLANPLPENDPCVLCLVELFGYQPGQQISFGMGLNEFLSALVAVRYLSGLIKDHDLFAIILCIEATIPFRGDDEHGRGHFDLMAERLSAMRQCYPYLGTSEEIDIALKRAVLFSNQDVETFRMKDAARFLDITFRLLPESNVALRKRGVYTIRDYRVGLQNMQRFLSTLNPDHVFNQYKDTPSPEEYTQMVRQAHKNLGTAQRYLEIKLIAMAVLEALAGATGGDAPLSLFMGDLPRPGVEIHYMQDYLPDIPMPDFIDPNSDLLRLLSEGLSEMGFDLPYSPTSLFIFKSLTEDEQKRLFGISEELFAGKITPEKFLALIPPHIVSPIARALAEMVFTRREKLLHYTNP